MSNKKNKKLSYHAYIQKPKNSEMGIDFIKRNPNFQLEVLTARDTKEKLEKMMQKKLSYSYMEPNFIHLYEYKEKLYKAETFFSERNCFSEKKYLEEIEEEAESLDVLKIKFLVYLYDNYQKDPTMQQCKYFESIFEKFDRYKANNVLAEDYENSLLQLEKINELNTLKEDLITKLKAVEKLRNLTHLKWRFLNDNVDELKEKLAKTLNEIFVRLNKSAKYLGYDGKIDKANHEQMRINKIMTLKNQILIKGSTVSLILDNQITDKLIKSSSGYRMIEATLKGTYGEEYTKIAMQIFKNQKAFKAINCNTENYCATFTTNFDQPENFIFTSAPCTFSDLYPLIHELGHYVYYEMYPNKLKLENMKANGYLTEVQSLLNELLLFEHLKKVSKNEKTRQIILKNFLYIQLDWMNLNMQKSLFECDCLKTVDLNTTYEDYEAKMQKLNLSINEVYKLIDNCEQENFEEIKYLNSLAVALRINKNFKKYGKEYVDKYLKCLHFVPAEECLKELDINLDDNSLYFDIIKYFNNIMEDINGFKEQEIELLNKIDKEKI